MDIKKGLLFTIVFLFLGGGGIEDCLASDHFDFSRECAATITSPEGTLQCSTWQKGAKAVKDDIDVAICICANSCPEIPENHYYYDDPENKTKQTDENNITLPVVLAWDKVKGWEETAGSYLWYWPKWATGDKESVSTKLAGIRSYLLEIDNTDNQLNDSKSAGGIFRKILKTNEFNPQKDFYPCFFNSETTYKWRVRPCCEENGENCLIESLAPWWTFTTSAAPEPIDPNDNNWNGSGSATTVSFDGLQIKWCKAFFQKTKKYATSYKLMVTSDEYGSQSCHPLLMEEGQCKDEDIYADQTTGAVVNFYPIDYRQDYAFFTRNHTYTWKMKSCYDDIANDCSDYGQTWTFSTRTDPIGIPAAQYPENDPSGTKLTGLPLSIKWSMPDGANSFIYETSFTSGEQKTTKTTAPQDDSPDVDMFDADNLEADTQYKWRVRACSNFNSTNCDGWSEWFSFKTTGRPPRASSLTATSDIPATFTWENVEAAKSYNFSLQESGEDPVITVINSKQQLESPKHVINYPDIDQDKTYYWKVQTCAHEDGTVCGEWSTEGSIATGQITTPMAKNPTAGETIYADQISHQLSWSEISGSAAYHYTLALTNPADTQDCQQGVIEGIAKSNSAIVQMKCLGEYSLAVEACIDSACQSVSPKGEWAIKLDQKTPSSKTSLAVCGTSYDNPDTIWNEREECQPKHLVLLIKVFLDFLIFKLSLFLLPILALITGFLFYSPFGTPDTLDKVKTMWKAIGIGYGLLLFGWLITGIIMSLAGYQGLWWKIL